MSLAAESHDLDVHAVAREHSEMAASARAEREKSTDKLHVMVSVSFDNDVDARLESAGHAESDIDVLVVRLHAEVTKKAGPSVRNLKLTIDDALLYKFVVILLVEPSRQLFLREPVLTVAPVVTIP